MKPRLKPYRSVGLAWMVCATGALLGAAASKIDSSLQFLATSGTPGGGGIIAVPSTLERVMPVAVNGSVRIRAFPRSTSTTASLASDLTALGLTDVKVYPGVVTGLLPLGKVAALENVASLGFARLPWARTQAGSVTTQADIGMAGPLARGGFNLSGAGKRVGIISDSFNALFGMFDGVDTGDLPPLADINVIQDDFGLDEGRAMAELVHDVAPGAAISFHAAMTDQETFADAILTLGGLKSGSAGNRCDVIVDDLLFLDEPMFADGVVAQAVDAVKAAGIPYFSSAGNQARQAFEDGPWRQSTVEGSPGMFRHRFNTDAANPETLLPITLGTGLTIFVLQWVDAYKSTSPSDALNLGATHDIDMYMHFSNGDKARFTDGGVVASRDSNVGNDPIELLAVRNIGAPLSLFLSFEYAINRGNTTSPTAGSPPLLKLVWFGSASVNAYPSKRGKGSIYGHANARGANAVGAVGYYRTPPYGYPQPQLQAYSAAGGTPVHYGVNGALLASPEDRAKPEFCAPDGGNTTFFAPGNDIEGDNQPNFFGTSAAAPVAAALAALMLEARPSLTPDQISTALRNSATDILPAGADPDSGFGLVHARTALALATAQTPALLGDLDGNGCVGSSDLAIVMTAISARSTQLVYDINRDGRVTIADARYLVTQFTNPRGTCP